MAYYTDNTWQYTAVTYELEDISEDTPFTDPTSLSHSEVVIEVITTSIDDKLFEGHVLFTAVLVTTGPGSHIPLIPETLQPGPRIFINDGSTGGAGTWTVRSFVPMDDDNWIFREIVEWVTERRVVDGAYALEDAPEAYRYYVREGYTSGRVLGEVGL